MSLLMCASVVHAQIPSGSKGQLKRNAMTAERYNDPYTAIKYYEAYLDKAPKQNKVRFRLAELYRKTRNYKAAKDTYEEVYRKQGEDFPLALFYQAEMERSLGKKEAAQKHYAAFLKAYRKGKERSKYRKLTKYALKGMALEESSEEVLVQHLDTSINKAHIEFAPIFLGEEQMVFASLRSATTAEYDLEKPEKRQRRQFYQAKKEGDQWKYQGEWEQVAADPNFDLGNGVITPDEQGFYFTKCAPRGNRMHCSIWRMNKRNGKWGEPEKLPKVINDPNYSVSQPAAGIDSKGREVLYFVSERNDGKGGSDIWYSTYNKRSKTFRAPRNCGSKINTPADEITPFFHRLNRQLYFSSNGLPGSGGLDIYRASGERSKWNVPEPLPRPINSSADDLYYHISPAGEDGFFSSNREGGVVLTHASCCDDLYYFVYPDHVKVELEAVVDNLEKNEQLSGVKIEVWQQIDSGNVALVQQGVSDGNGVVRLPLEAGHDYELRAKGEGYLMNKVLISTKENYTDAQIDASFHLEPLPQKAITIKNIYYEFNKSNLTASATTVIDTTIYRILQDNPEIVVEISSHTDGKGTEGFNRHLSQKRAESVVKYLRSKGIDKQRLQAKGYGESRPIAPNKNSDGSDNPEGRAKNRRTEFKVIGLIDAELLEED